MHRTRNAAWVQAHRGFESPPLRQVALFSRHNLALWVAYPTIYPTSAKFGGLRWRTRVRPSANSSRLTRGRKACESSQPVSLRQPGTPIPSAPPSTGSQDAPSRTRARLAPAPSRRMAQSLRRPPSNFIALPVSRRHDLVEHLRGLHRLYRALRRRGRAPVVDCAADLRRPSQARDVAHRLVRGDDHRRE